MDPATEEAAELFWQDVQVGNEALIKQYLPRASGDSFLITHPETLCNANIYIHSYGQIEDIAIKVSHQPGCICKDLLKPQESGAAAARNILTLRRAVSMEVGMSSLPLAHQQKLAASPRFVGHMKAWAKVLGLICTFKKAMGLNVPQPWPRFGFMILGTCNGLAEFDFFIWPDVSLEAFEGSAWADDVPPALGRQSFHIVPGTPSPVLVIDE